MKTKILNFLAKHPLGSAVKVGLGAALAYVIDNISAFNLNPAVAAAVIAAVTIAINALNPKDPRYGRSLGE